MMNRIVNNCCAVLVLASMCPIAMGANADWNTATSNWDIPGNWTGGTGAGGLPGAGDVARILNGGTAQITGALTEPTVNQVYAGQGFGTSGNITQSGGSLTATNWVVVGDAAGSTGTYTMTGGSLNVINDVLSVSNSGGAGTFTLNGPGTVTAQRIYVGRAGGGTGIFNQTGGTVTSNQWTVVGEGGGTTGTYTLSGGGTLNVNSDIFYVGLSGGSGTFNLGAGNVNGPQMRVGAAGGTGIFNQNAGGTVAMSGESLIGFQGGSNGTYTQALGAGAHTSGSWLSVGRDGGTGVYNKNGASNDFHGTLQIGINGGSNGTFNLSNGSLTTTAGGDGNGIGSVTVGYNGGLGALNIANGATLNTGSRTTVGWGSTGSIDVAAGGTYNGVDMWVGRNTGGNGTVTTAGTFNLSNVLALGSGFAGSTGTMNQTGGTVTVQADTLIGAEPGGTGIYNQSGGTFTGNAETTIGLNNSTGTYNLTGGTATINARTRVGWNGTGTLNVSPGATFNGVDMWVGRNEGIVASGTVTTAGNFNLSNVLALGSGGGGAGTPAVGTFTQTGGTVNVGNQLHVGIEGEQGFYNMQGGTLNQANGDFTIGNQGGSTGTFTQTGGTVNTNNPGGWTFVGVNGGTGTLNLSAGTFNANGTLISIGHNATGTVNHSGSGTLNANEVWIGWSGTGNGTYNISGGTLNANAILGLARDAGNTGLLNITGGTVNTPTVADGPGTSTINIDGGTLNLTGANATVDHLRVGQNANGSHTITAGETYNVNTQLIVGNNGNTGTITQTGGAVNALLDGTGGPGQWAFIGANGGTGVYNISGGSFDTSAGTLLAVGGGQGSGTGTVNQSGGSTVTARELWIGWNGGSTGAYNLTSGTLTVNDRLGLGRSGGNGTFTQDGGTASVTNAVFIGEGGSTGTLNMNGGTFTQFNGDFNVGNGGGATGTINQTGGVIQTNVNSGWTFIGHNGGNGTLNLSGGTFDADQGTLVAVSQNGGTGTVNQTGGTLNANELWVGWDGGANGTYNISSGTLNVADRLGLGRGGATGTMNITGGTVNVGTNVVASNGSATFNHSGGIANVTGNMDLGTGGGPGVYNLSGTGELDFLDTAPVTQAPNANPSTLTVGANGTFNFDGGILRNVTTIDVTSATGQTFTQNGGQFVIGVDDGLDPNNPATTRAITTITGDYDQNAGELLIDIFGPGSHGFNGETGSMWLIDPLDPNLDSDLLHVMGDAELDGTLAINLNGFEPLPFHFYDVLLADGAIDAEDLTLTGVNLFRVIENPFGPGQLLQVATPEPASLILWALLGIVGIAGYVRLRRKK